MNAIVRSGALGISMVCLTLVASGMAAEPSKRRAQEAEPPAALPSGVDTKVFSVTEGPAVPDGGQAPVSPADYGILKSGLITRDAGATPPVGLRRADDLRPSRPSLTFAAPRTIDEESASPAVDRAVTGTFEELEILLDGTLSASSPFDGGQPAGGTCDPECDRCWCGTQREDNCDPLWFYDSDCDCGCQFCDLACPDCAMQDCRGGPTGGACCSAYQPILQCIENTSQQSCLSDGGAFMGNGVTCAMVDGCANRCDSECVWCWTDTLAEDNCDPTWNGDGECDCGCQYCDSDCPSCGVDVGACCGPYQPTPECVENTEQQACLDMGGAYMGDGVTCAAVDGCANRCDSECMWCWTGTLAEDDCDPAWNGDGECDCGCQYCDSDCPSCGEPVCGDGVCECSRGETIASCPADCIDVPCGAAPSFQVCTNDYGEFCASTVLLCPCEPQCDNCWQGDCEPWRDGDGPCDCRCQFCDSDCPEYPDCCIPGPAPGYSYTAVFPPGCGTTDPAEGWSEWDPDAGAYLFCSTYTVGTCQGDVCLRFWIEWEGPCDPELWWHFDQNDADYCACVGSCGNGVCEPNCGENCDTCLQDCLPGAVVWSDPPNCAIDARQTSKPDCTEPCGWNVIDIMFDDDASCLTEQDFEVRLVPDDGVPPTITEVLWRANTATLVLDNPVPPGRWTCFDYLHSQPPYEVCLGRLPGDVSADRTSAPADILWLIDCLNGVRSCEYWQCDVDRSALCGPPDILRVIDLLNGAGCYDFWLNVSLPPCPNGP